MLDGFVKVAAATPALRVADPIYNVEKMKELIAEASEQGVKLLVFPELAITGYTCGDLFVQEQLYEVAMQQLKSLSEQVGNMLVAVGAPLRCRGKLYSCAVFMGQKHILGAVPKTHLPNYAEFYERRHFEPAFEDIATLNLEGETFPVGTDLLFQCAELPQLKVAAEICEDLWVPAPPSIRHALAGATVIVNPSASDETIGKAAYRRGLVSGQAARLYCGYVYADAGEGESTTDMVYSGHNLIAENGSILAESKLFSHGLTISEIDVGRISYERLRTSTYPATQAEGYQTILFSIGEAETTKLTRKVAANPFVPEDDQDRLARCESILAMQISGLKKRVEHTNAKTLVVAVSGGLDSTLALLVAAGVMDRLGRSRQEIIGVMLPCFGTTSRTKNNAEKLCEYLGISSRTISIKAAVRQHFEDIGHDENVFDVTYENSQARERTQVVMDIANQTGGLMVGTGDLSELALGWATYGGDHISMYGVNGSIPKTLVRHLIYTYAQREGGALKDVLLDILDTPVSPELLPAENDQIVQKTEEIVGPYELHDFILYYVLRYGFRPRKILRLAEIAFEGRYTSEVILYWLRSFYRRFFAQQFKRSCLPDGPKVGSVTLSPRGDWRMPSDASANAWMMDLENL